MKFKSKKGFNINQVPSLGLVLVIIAIVLGLGVTILSQIKSTQCTYSYSALNGCLNSTGGTGGTLGDTLASNITTQGVQSVTTLSGWQTTWAIIIAAAVVIGILGAYLMFKNRE